MQSTIKMSKRDTQTNKMTRNKVTFGAPNKLTIPNVQHNVFNTTRKS
jgi:hypothetical protein